MEISYIIYFVVGVISNILFTLQIRYIDHNKAASAAIMGFMVSVFSFAVLYSILTQLQGIAGIIWYAGGIGVGTFVGTKAKFKYKGKDWLE